MQRLATRSQFQAVLAGDTIARTPHFALHCTAFDVPVSEPRSTAAPGTPVLFAVHDVWMGAMVPKRWAKRAVTRNAIKRQIYGVSVDFESKLSIAAHVVRLRAGFDRAQFASATSDALKAAVQIGRAHV